MLFALSIKSMQWSFPLRCGVKMITKKLIGWVILMDTPFKLSSREDSFFEEF